MARWSATLALLVLAATAACSHETLTPSWGPGNALFFSDFEADNGGLTGMPMITPDHGPTPANTPPSTVPESWEWGALTTHSAHSGSNVWATNLGGDYLNFEWDCLTLDQPVPAGGATWDYWVRWDIESQCDCDYEIVRVCDTGANADIGCDELDRNGNNNGNGHQFWTEQAWDLTPYAGLTKRLEICLTADDGATYDGIAVDDFGVFPP